MRKDRRGVNVIESSQSLMSLCLAQTVKFHFRLIISDHSLFAFLILNQSYIFLGIFCVLFTTHTHK